MTSRCDLDPFRRWMPPVRRLNGPEGALGAEDGNPPVGPEGGRVPAEVESSIRRARGGGRPLERSLRERMGAILGHDFSAVRVHTGPGADRLNSLLDAEAFTTGSDIFFKRGAYDPTTSSGRELIAHELVHVVQQRTGQAGGYGNGPRIRPAGDALEREAEVLARRAAANAGSIRRGGGLIGIPAVPPCPGNSKGNARTHPASRCTVIQRQVARFVQAAREQISPRLTREAANLRPNNCHEAVLGWLLISMNYPRPWRLIREEAARRFPVGAMGTGGAFTGQWMWNNFYTGHTTQVNFDNIAVHVHQGDILVAGIGAAHSMAVVADPQLIAGIVHPAPAGTQTHHVYIRGYNNIGSFGQLLGSAMGLPPYAAGYNQVPTVFPPAQYDGNDRDVAHPNLWRTASRDDFGMANVPLYVVGHNNARIRIAQFFPYENSPIPSNNTPRWHFNIFQGWRWF